MPLKVPVPSPLSTKEIPLGRAPVTLSAGVGWPLAVTAKERVWPTCTEVEVVVVVIEGAAEARPTPMVIMGVMSGLPPLVLAAWSWKL